MRLHVRFSSANARYLMLTSSSYMFYPSLQTSESERLQEQIRETEVERLRHLNRSLPVTEERAQSSSPIPTTSSAQSNQITPGHGPLPSGWGGCLNSLCCFRLSLEANERSIVRQSKEILRKDALILLTTIRERQHGLTREADLRFRRTVKVEPLIAVVADRQVKSTFNQFRNLDRCPLAGRCA